MRTREQVSLADRLSQVDPELAKYISNSGHFDGYKSDDKVSVKPAVVKSSDLGPSQTTMRLDDVLGNALEMLYTGASNPVKVGAIVSSDNRIMDGHHRWAASIIAFGNKAGLRAWKSDLPGSQLVRVLNLLSKGKFKVTKGNMGSASINDLTPSKVRERLLEFLQNGRNNKYFSFSPEEFKSMLENNFGDVETGIEVMSDRASLINKSIPGWAPQRVDMPVIESDQIPEVSRALGNGELDWSPPFADEINAGRVAMVHSNTPSTRRVMDAYRTKRSKTAGMVQHIKDNSGSDDWAYGVGGAIERDIRPAFKFDPKELKPLLKSLRSTLVALGNVSSAYANFVKIKSRKISPDGQLGGKGYIQKISDMRRSLMNCVEALSAFTDTVYDEVNAPHWNPEALPMKEQREVEEIKEDIQEIREDPEEWAENQSDEMDEENLEEIEEEMTKESSSVKKVARTFLQSRRQPLPPGDFWVVPYNMSGSSLAPLIAGNMSVAMREAKSASGISGVQFVEIRDSLDNVVVTIKDGKVQG